MSVVVDIRDLYKEYGGFTAVDGLSLQIHAGEIFAILGPNGAGKTTTVEILEGFRKRTSGSVSVLGFDPGTSGNSARAWRDRIGIVLQTSQDAGDLTVEETVEHFTHYYSKPRKASDVIALVGLEEKSKDLIRNLSGGQRRRLDVALGIVGSPELLFLDEPTTGFDPEARRAFWQLIKSLRDQGTTIVLTTHYLDEAEELADRVAVVSKGKIIAVSTPSELGGRATALARVRWNEGEIVREEESENPTELVIRLSEEFGDEVPGLAVIRPTLEDIYLSMIEGSDE